MCFIYFNLVSGFFISKSFRILVLSKKKKKRKKEFEVMEKFIVLVCVLNFFYRKIFLFVILGLLVNFYFIYVLF